MNTQEERYSLKVKESIDACLKSHYLSGSKHENVVVMLSGGMDSVSLAWSLLEHTEQNIHIHAIHLDNSEGRFRAEGKAIYDSVKWLKENQRSFEFSSSLYSWKASYPGGRDMALAMFQACRTINTWPLPCVAVYTGDYNMGKEEIAEAYGILNACSTGKTTKAIWATPFDFLSRVSVERSLGVYYAMPSELRDVYWSCRKPVETPEGFVVCGSCHACYRQKEMQEAIKNEG